MPSPRCVFTVGALILSVPFSIPLCWMAWKLRGRP